MTVRVLFFAQARERAGRASATLELPQGSRVADALAMLEQLHPSLAELRPHLAVALNQRLARPDALITGEAELALLPPVSGGSPAGTPRTKRPARRNVHAADAFQAAGFTEVTRRSKTRPIMRRVLRGRG